jgi:hypothetical protein
MDDTSPEVRPLLRRLYAERSPAERFRMGAEMFDTAPTMVLASLPPQLPEDERRRRLCERLYGRELAERVFGA